MYFINKRNCSTTNTYKNALDCEYTAYSFIESHTKHMCLWKTLCLNVFTQHVLEAFCFRLFCILKRPHMRRQFNVGSLKKIIFMTHCDSVDSSSFSNRQVRSFPWLLPITSKPQISNTGTSPHYKVTAYQLKSYCCHNSNYKNSCYVQRYKYKRIISQRPSVVAAG